MFRLLLSTFFSVLFLSTSPVIGADTLLEQAKKIISGAVKPVDQDTQKRRAAANVLEALDKTPEPDAVLVLPTDLLRNHLLAASRNAGENLTLEQTDIGFDQGAARLTSNFEYSTQQLDIEGRFDASISFAVSGGYLFFLPAVQNIDLKKLNLKTGTILGNKLTSFGVSLLQQTPELLSGVLTETVAPLSLKIKPLDIDLGGKLRKMEGIVEATAPRIVLNASLQEGAVWIDKDKVTALATFGFDKPDARVPAPPQLDLYNESDPAKVSKKIEMVLVDLTGGHMENSGIAIRRTRLASLMNKLMVTTGTVATAILRPEPIRNQKFSEKIELAEHANFSCRPERQCDQSENCRANLPDCRPTRSCDRQVDTRNCSACILKNPFGGCIQRGNDPICEAQKAGQNAAYASQKASCEAQKSSEKATCEANKSASIAACEARKAGRKLDCERLKAQEQTQCEVKKASQNLLAELGGVGNLSGNFDVVPRAVITLSSLTFSPDLSDAQITARIAGKVTLNGRLAFVPYDILGHLSCSASWDKPVTITVLAQPVNIRASLALGQIGDAVEMTFVLPEQTVHMNTSEPPLKALFNHNPDLRVLCPGLNALDIASDAIKRMSGRDAIPALQGKFSETIAGMSVNQPLDVVSIDIDNRTISLKPRLSQNSLFFEIAHVEQAQ